MAKIKKMKFYNDFYIQGDLPDENIAWIDKVLEMGKVDKLKSILQDSAKLAGRECVQNIKLYDAQTLPVAMSLFNKTLFIGDKPGLGKTVMSAGAYALWRKKAIENGEDIGKLILVTDSSHVVGMTNEYRKYGIKLKPLYGGSVKIERATEGLDMTTDEWDGVATNWDSLKVNGFLFYYLDNQDYFTCGVFDETSAVKNNKNMLFENAKKIADNLERKIFLNGSTFETSIMDIFNQFKVLNDSVLPLKKFLNERYVIQGKRSWYESQYDFATNRYKPVKRFAYRIANYTNQSELKERLKYFYIARSKKDFSKDLPLKTYILHPVEMTGIMAREMSESNSNYDVILNSPTTSDKSKKFTYKSVPKFEKLINLFESMAEERPVIYCLHRDSQKEIQNKLRNLGYRIGIINGELDSEEKQKELQKFEDKTYDGLIINVKKAISIFSSNAMIFYNVPTNSQATYQIMARIDRNNYKDSKQYHFLVYLESPEVMNMIELAHFREEHSGKFTGQEEDVYAQLIKQLENHLEGGEE